MNNYADRNKITVDLIIPEPIMSDALATTVMHKDKKLKRLILCSLYQLHLKI